MADMMQPMSPDASASGMTPPAPEPDADDTSMPGSVQIPLDSFGGNPPAEGSTIKLKVVSVDQETGTVSAEVMQTPKRGRGIQEAAGEFGSERY